MLDFDMFLLKNGNQLQKESIYAYMDYQAIAIAFYSGDNLFIKILTSGALQIVAKKK